MSVKVVMVPGWQAKVRGPMLDFQREIAGGVMDDVLTNIISGGHIDTGAMINSVHQDGTRVVIGTDHWHYIEFGTDPHIIRPSVKKALWWDGAPHPMAQVNHPGSRPYAVMQRALYTKRG